MKDCSLPAGAKSRILDLGCGTRNATQKWTFRSGNPDSADHVKTQGRRGTHLFWVFVLM